MKRFSKAFISVILCIALLVFTGCQKDSTKENLEIENETIQVVETEETEIPVTEETENVTLMETEEETVPQYVQESEVSFHNYILRDSLGIDSVSTWLPDGWTYEVTSYTTICESYPIQSFISLVAPDGTYGITMQTPMGYAESIEYPTQITEGTHTPDDKSHEILSYRTFLHARNASEYIDYFLAERNLQFDGFYDMPIDHEAEEKLINETNDYMYYQLDILQKSTEIELSNSSMSADIYPAGMDASIAIKRGPIVGGGFIEARCVANQYTIRRDAHLNDNLLGLVFTTDDTYWRQFGTVVYWANSEEIFNENYDVCNFIINNTATTRMYQAAQEEILRTIIPQIIAGNIELYNYAADTIRSVADNYSSTNDRVAQMWDDYILEQDRYSLSDGTEVIVPYTANYVYADGDGNIKWSEYADYDPGAGFTQIN